MKGTSVSNAWLQEDLSKVHLAFLIWAPHMSVPMGRGGWVVGVHLLLKPRA